MACTGIHVIDPRCQLGNVAGNITDDAFSKMAHSFGDAAASSVNWLWRELNEATLINLSSAGITKDLVATGAIAGILCTALFVIQVITAALRREPGGLARSVKGLFVALVASTFAIAATKIVLAAVDDLSAGVVKYATGSTIEGLGPRFALATSLASMHNPAALLLFSLVILAAVVIVWAAMMMRKMLIIVAAVMTPLAFAGGAADITRSWVRRWIEFTAALIASKLLLVIMLMIGLSVFEGAGMAGSSGSQTGTQVGTQAGTQAGTQLATGSVLLLMAGLAPWIAIKMFHFAGDSLHAVHAQAQAARSGTQTMVAAPRKVNGYMAQGHSIGTTMAGGQSPTVSAAGLARPGITSSPPPRLAASAASGGAGTAGLVGAAVAAPVSASRAVAQRAGAIVSKATGNGRDQRPAKNT
jgi:type IV secretion system protein TrbL